MWIAAKQIDFDPFICLSVLTVIDPLFGGTGILKSPWRCTRKNSELKIPQGLNLLLMEILLIILAMEIILVIFLGIFFLRKLFKIRKDR